VGHEITTLHLSTTQFPNRDRVEAFREAFGRAILRFEMEPLPGTPLEADMLLRAFPGLGMASGVLSPMRNRHTAELIDNDDFVLAIVRRGHAVLERGGRTIDVRAGQAVLTANDDLATFTGHTQTHVINFRLSRERFKACIRGLGDALGRVILPESPALRLMNSYADILNAPQASEQADLRDLAAAHLYDLAALSVGATLETLQVASGRGLRAARLAAVYREFERSVLNPEFSLTALAGRLAVTPRYVQRLLAEAGTSFSDELTRRRLTRARDMLASVNTLHLSVTEIALECGFSTVAHFHRMFRREFAETPGDVRVRR
jgi:AraC-like DNA-binding protein